MEKIWRPPVGIVLQGGLAGALDAAWATPDDAGGGGGPLLRGQLRSEARGGADEVAAEMLLPCGGAAGDGGLQPRLQKASTESILYSPCASGSADTSLRPSTSFEVAPSSADCCGGTRAAARQPFSLHYQAACSAAASCNASRNSCRVPHGRTAM
jgi:hypothetical protein